MAESCSKSLKITQEGGEERSANKSLSGLTKTRHRKRICLPILESEEGLSDKKIFLTFSVVPSEFTGTHQET